MLTNVTSLQIRGEFISGSDNGDLDNVILSGGLAGDFNQNGIVDTADYIVWRKANTTSTPLPNDTGLGVPIGAAHYNLWRANYGNPPAAALAFAIPEPTSVLLAASALATLALARRRWETSLH